MIIFLNAPIALEILIGFCCIAMLLILFIMLTRWAFKKDEDQNES